MKSHALIALLSLVLVMTFGDVKAQMANDSPLLSIIDIKKDVIDCDRLEDLVSLDIHDNFLILSFTMYIERPEKLIVEESSSNYLTSRMKKVLSGCESGDVLHFGNIVAKDLEGNVLKLESLSFLIQ